MEIHRGYIVSQSHTERGRAGDIQREQLGTPMMKRPCAGHGSRHLTLPLPFHPAHPRARGHSAGCAQSSDSTARAACYRYGGLRQSAPTPLPDWHPIAATTYTHSLGARPRSWASVGVGHAWEPMDNGHITNLSAPSLPHPVSWDFCTH
jgi:hypothetical protein